MSTDLSRIETASDLLRSTPLAGADRDVVGLLTRLDALVQGLRAPLRVAVLGEVKAGKSTLVNAIVGSEVAPADVLEASAIVTLLRHGSGRGSVFATDGTQRPGSVQDIVKLLTDHRGDEEFAVRTSHAELELPLGSLRGLELLDTPGLAAASTLPEKTLERLNDYDVVIWVFNATRQGESRVLEEFERVGDLGNPILAVVNRIDKIPPGELERVINKFERDIDVFADEIIPLSAKRALDGEPSELDDLRDHLESYSRAPDAAKVRAVGRQLASMLAASAHLHEAAASQGAAEAARRDAWAGRLQRAGAHVLDEAEAAAERWIRDDLISAQIPLLEEAAGDSASALEAVIADRVGPDVLQGEVARLLEHVKRKIEVAWEREGAAIQAELRDVGLESDLRMREHLDQAASLISRIESGGSNAAGEVILHGGMGAAAGAGIAAYVALIGPAAPAIYLGGALAAFVPPLVIGGVAAGIIKAAVGRRKERDRRKRQVIDLVEGLRADFRDKVWRERLRPGVRNLTDDLITQLSASSGAAALTEPGAAPETLRSHAEALRLCSDAWASESPSAREQ